MLHAAYERGRVAALTKFAAVPLARPMPAARGLAMPHPAAAAPHAPPAAMPHPTPAAAPQPHPGYQLAPHEEAQAQRMRGMSPEQRANELGLGRDAQNAHFMQQHGIAPAGAAPAAAPSMLSRMGAGAQRFMRPVKRGLGLAALAGAGALAYGLHQQNKEDQDARDLVYAPMEGTYG